MSLLGDGVKIQSIFGFCDIRNFTDTTECLQEEVMLFVNRIANILHGIVVQCQGAANKNIGDAFLLTWKLDKSEMNKGGKQEFVGDQALLSLLKTTAEMARHEDFICNFSSTALSILYERMPGYKCKMGCGLHMGWAVEGAIGSDKKIDASYISPHVNWSEFLESSTKEYGVPVLMSEPFYKLLSDDVKKWCRQVDHIKKSSSDEVTGLYTYDVNPDYDFKAKAIRDAKGSSKTNNNKEKRRTEIGGTPQPSGRGMRPSFNFKPSQLGESSR
jgi:class 3 adenylate cyclase